MVKFTRRPTKTTTTTTRMPHRQRSYVSHNEIRGGLVLLSLSVLSIGYMMYTPLPPTLVNPWRGRIVTWYMDAMETAAWFLSSFTNQEPSLYVSQWSNMIHLTAFQYFPDIQVVDTHLEGVPVRVYRPKAAAASIPAVVYFHGGGWVQCNIDSHDGWNVQLALKTGMAVIAVNYRKAPAHPYPIPFEDCLHVTQHVLKHGTQLGVDSKQVFVAGDSAGGNLAAAVALRLSSDDPSVLPPLKGQVLVSPVLQAMTFNTPSYKETPNVVLSQERMILYWSAYLGVPFNEDTLTSMLQDRHVSTKVQRSKQGSYAGKGKGVVIKISYDVSLAAKLDKLVLDPFVAPLMADDQLLKKLPATFILACEFEHLRDEVELYAHRLKEAGVQTDFVLEKGQAHPLAPMLTLPSFLFDNSDIVAFLDKVSSFLVKQQIGNK